MPVKYQEPSKEQIELMQQYSDICGEAIDLIMKCEDHITLQHASARMQESMSWFHSYVINGGKLKKGN